MTGVQTCALPISADKSTGLVPVVVRLPNSKERLRCGVPVHVRFDAAHVGSPQAEGSTRSVTRFDGSPSTSTSVGFHSLWTSL